MCIRDRYMGISYNYFLREGLMKVTSIILLSLAFAAISAQVIQIVPVVSSTRTATCPGGFQPSSCGCGLKCGSTHMTFGRKKQCHCQCVPTDWSVAHCMQLRTEQNIDMGLVVTEAHTSTLYATCPAGTKATGCSCGNTRGDYLIHNQVTCQCLTADSGWTKAYCAKPADARYELHCQYRKVAANPVTATPGLIAVGCSCGNSCNSYTLANNQCNCHPGCGSTWTAINECRVAKTPAAIAAEQAAAAAAKRAAEEAARQAAAAAAKRAAEEAARQAAAAAAAAAAKRAAEEAARQAAAAAAEEAASAAKKAAEELLKKLLDRLPPLLLLLQQRELLKRLPDRLLDKLPLPLLLLLQRELLKKLLDKLPLPLRRSCQISCRCRCKEGC
eukprot:TRINITY_DN946_c0_g1_i24.p3 TRINITY_DN946_c0_g1~~TRINITY_DN946_c0_g1_i24.p3  ORF type:complete len:387 (-),score=87.13 TRINITY_DN946_c0_g1_i24:191-1351(-)